MKPPELGTVHAALPPAEKALADTIEGIFGRLPALHGYVAERPDGAGLLLRGRTFARSLQ